MPVAAATFDFVRALIRDEAGIVLEPGKEYLVESRLLPLARKAKQPDVDALISLARGVLGANIRRQVVDAMTINETSFFRDVAPFECLRTEVLPALVEARRAERSLAIWCGASSTGQEPYTIAMLIHEHFPDLLSWKIAFIATDLSAEVLARARTGRYSQIEVNRGLPASYAVKYFEPHGTEWQVQPRVRDMVTFQELNLNKTWPAFPPLDIVLMRNVMIYFDVEAKKQILTRVRSALRTDGYLFLGAAESPMDLVDGYARVGFERSGCYRNALVTVATS
jgi:chemotaxis protein methyltransferase CheR